MPGQGHCRPGRGHSLTMDKDGKDGFGDDNDNETMFEPGQECCHPGRGRSLTTDDIVIQ